MILDDERQEGEWLKLRKKKTWTRNTERSLGSPENIAQWPMILKKKKEEKKNPSSDVTISSQGRVYWC